MEKALTVLRRATAQPEASGELFARLGVVYFQLNKIDLATNATLTAIKKSPRSLPGYQNLFQFYAQAKQPAPALGVLNQASKVSRVTPEFLVGLGELYLRFGFQYTEQKSAAHARALEIFQRAAKSDLDEVSFQLRLADGLNALGKSELASPVYEALLKNLPDVPSVRDNVRAKLADIYLRGTDRRRAAILLEAIVQDHPTDARAYYFLGNIAVDETNFVKAVECFSKTVLLDPAFEPAYGELASAQLALNKNAEAQATLAGGREKFPRRFLLEYLSGLTASQQKDFTNAVQFLTTAEIIAQATDAKRLNYLFYFQFGSACERLGDLDQAARHFEKCLELSPNFDEAQNYLGFMWVEHGRNLERARDLIDRALKTEPKNPAYLDSMAWALLKLNQPQPALAFALRAVANSPEEDAEIFHHLGDIYAALGQTEKAREAWRNSLRLEPNELLRKKLDQGVP